MATRRSIAGGFALAEVLVALFVLAVGILGAAAMQVSAARTRHESALMSAAAQLAGALAERMAANGAQLRLPDSDNAYLGAPGAAPVCRGACTPAQLAASDLRDAADSAARLFPGGQIRACRDDLRGALAWECSGDPGDPLVVKVGWRQRVFVTAVAVVVPELP